MQWAIESVAAVASAQAAAPISNATASAADNASTASSFAKLLQRELAQLNNSVSTAENTMHNLAAGKSVQLHKVMISLEQARLSVQTFVQVRNKLVESYQDLMRMQL